MTREKMTMETTLKELINRDYTIGDLLDILNNWKVPKKNRNVENSLEYRVTFIMHEIGIPANIIGHNYLRQAIIMAYKDPDVLNCVTKSLYPSVAEKYSTTPLRVTKAIRHAIGSAWARKNIKIWQKYFSYTIDVNKRKPTNSECIAMIAERLRMEDEKVS